MKSKLETKDTMPTVDLDALPDSTFTKLEETLCDNSGKTPLHERFRALFTLRNLPQHERAIDIISKSILDKKNDSALLKHELAYCLGQMKDTYACKTLEITLSNVDEDAMVRHEAAEALGAIGDMTSIDILQKYLERPGEKTVVTQTCELAIEKIKYENSNTTTQNKVFNSIDPAPAISTIGDVNKLRATLLDVSLPLFERYRAMFRLRDLAPCSLDAIEALSEGLRASRRPEAREQVEKSALFRHEIAYVFGQLSDPASVPALVESLQDEDEVDMVRHEAAEALGSIATEDVLPVLRNYSQSQIKSKDVPRVVRESCVVALDMYQYENSGKLEYADGLAV